MRDHRAEGHQMKIADGFMGGLLPGHFVPAEMDKGFKWGKVVGVLFLRSDPEIDFHSGWIGFSPR